MKIFQSCPFHQLPAINEFDALDPATRENPWPYYDWLRSNSGNGVYRLPQEENFFLVHDYEDVKNIFTDSENFSSRIIPSRRAAFPALADGEEHSRIRNLMLEIFHQKNLLLFEKNILHQIQKATADLTASENSEVFETWANVIPLASLCTLFGFETTPAFLKKLHDDSIAINKALFVTGGTGPRRSNRPSFSEKIKIAGTLLLSARKILRLRKYVGKKGMKELSEMIIVPETKIPLPRPSFEHIPSAINPLLDLMLLFAETLKQDSSSNSSITIFRKAMATGKISEIEMIMTGAFIFFAGYETTSSLLSNSVVHLSRNPELYNTLKSNPNKLEDFMEEALRFYTPVGRFLRRAKKEITINGTLIPKDSIIILMSGAANTDPEKFTDGCSFNIDRENNHQHLSFGKGAHFCVGAPLARMQVTLALRELLGTAKSIKLRGAEKMKMVTDRDNGILRFEKVFVKVEADYQATGNEK